MNLNNLKPAWQQFRLSNGLTSLDREEILFIIDRAEGVGVAVSKTNRLLMNTIMLVVFTFCCQGG